MEHAPSALYLLRWVLPPRLLAWENSRVVLPVPLGSARWLMPRCASAAGPHRLPRMTCLLRQLRPRGWRPLRLLLGLSGRRQCEGAASGQLA